MIKALYDYDAPADSDSQLSFSAGDFLHVVSRENDNNWYEACNPLKNERGLVPVTYFDTVSKTVRDSAESRKSGSATHDSGYAESAMQNSSTGHRSSKAGSKGIGGVFGVVIYDFKAERPDELDATAEEAVIVIAQSNPEWYVAKPITRLGGPGLIPVSFIQLKDMATGQPVADEVGAVRRAGIPTVEDWKRMASEYKNTSIPLGTVSSSQQIQSLQQGMNRMSLNNGQQNGYAHDSKQYAQQQQQNLLAPVRASVARYIFADEKFHFIVESKMSNGTHWDLSRIYEDFYQLQISLISAFPEEAGQIPGRERILPYMPGPVRFVTDNISEGRRSSLNEYLRDLLQLPEHIATSLLVQQFFAPRQGDYEVDPNAVDLDEHARTEPAPNRYSSTSQGSHPNGAYQQPLATGSNAPYASYPTQGSNGYAPQRQPQSLEVNTQDQRGHSRSSSGSRNPQSSQQSINASGTSLASAPQVKIKTWFDRDTCVLIRMPPRGQFTLAQLRQKIVERRRLEYKGQDQDNEDIEIQYRDGQDGEYYKVEGDEDLDIGLERNEKLTLAVRTRTR